MYSEWSQTSKMELFAKIVHGVQLLTIFSKSSILGVWLGSKYASHFSFSRIIHESVGVNMIDDTNIIFSTLFPLAWESVEDTYF